MYLIIGNIIAFAASLIMVYYGLLEDKKKILFYQTIQFALSVVSNILLGGITGAIIYIISIIRNIFCYKEKLGIILKIIITIISVLLSLIFNNMGIIGLLPVISIIIYTWFMNVKNIKIFKLLVSLTMLLWLIYDLYIMSYTSALFEFLNILANIITIVQMSIVTNKQLNYNK